MKFLSFLSVIFSFTPTVIGLGSECYDCQTIVQQLQARGKDAVAGCYNPKFPRKQQPQCTTTTTCGTTVTRKFTSTKTSWEYEQPTRIITGTGPSIVKTIAITRTNTVTKTDTLTDTDTVIVTNAVTNTAIITVTNTFTATNTITSTETVLFTALATETQTQTVLNSVLTTGYTPTFTERETLTTSIIEGSDIPVTTVVVTVGSPEKKRDIDFDSNSSSAACYCLHGLEPKLTSTVKVNKTATKSVAAITTTTNTSTLKPVTKYVDIPGVTRTVIISYTVVKTDIVVGTETAVETDTVLQTDIVTKTDTASQTENVVETDAAVETQTTTTRTETAMATLYTTESMTVYAATTLTETILVTRTIAGGSTSGTVTATCRPTGTGACKTINAGLSDPYRNFRTSCGLKIRSDAINNIPVLGAEERQFTIAGTQTACQAVESCASTAASQTNPAAYYSFFVTRVLGTGEWRCTIQYGASQGLDDDSYVSDPTGLEAFFYSVGADLGR
ncbi:hypothetical protein H072_4125 [Dactylellina haptotyla CBS 200.50]|uniref:Apple domain-containing protein n=1 Tax=Dactylellina haptotyla (strain CBS 200.50) TaxID=1284197 RepID=S8AGC1_DACHA|nr:hypothetical protein H072_4125 [Dactylellina haptotyla CBS 200.50]